MYCIDLYIYIQLRPTSIEKEIFPAMAADNQLYACELKGKILHRKFLEKLRKSFA